MPSRDIHYHRNLPHSHPEGYPLFITFRLADSLPIAVLTELRTQRQRELETLNNKSVDERYGIEIGHFGRYDEWLDRCCYGPRSLESADVARIVARKIHALDNDRYQLLTYCIMPNHVHLLIEAIAITRITHRGKTANYPVADTLRLLKGSTARDCNLKLQRNGRFWHHESYDHYARDEQDLERIIKYILYNPVKAGLTKDWKKWQFTYINPRLGSW